MFFKYCFLTISLKRGRVCNFRLLTLFTSTFRSIMELMTGIEDYFRCWLGISPCPHKQVSIMCLYMSVMLLGSPEVWISINFECKCFIKISLLGDQCDCGHTMVFNCQEAGNWQHKEIVCLCVDRNGQCKHCGWLWEILDE